MITERYLKIIDISSNQGSMDWARAVAAGVDGVCIRAGYGLVKDSLYDDFAIGAHLYRLPQSAYWAIYPQYSIATQAARFLEQLQSVEQVGVYTAFPLWADCEITGGKSAQYISNAYADFLDIINSEGYLQAIYTRASFWNPNTIRWTGWADYDLVVAHYGATNPAIPLDWQNAGKTWSVWQYSADGNNAGRPHGAGSAALDLSFARRSHMKQNGAGLNAHNLLSKLEVV